MDRLGVPNGGSFKIITLNIGQSYDEITLTRSTTRLS